MPNTTSNRGVYFLANDRVIELATAFLNSFRHYNPKLRLCLIPYDGQCERLLALRNRYDFEVYSHHELLVACDRMSGRFHDQASGHYRKLAAWNGEFDEFVYIDIDTVVLDAIDFVFPYLADYEFVTASARVPGNRHWVWKESVGQMGYLTQEEIDYAANTCFIASRNGLLRLVDVQARLEEAIKYKEHMELSCAEQPLLNYLIITSGMRYTSLYELNACSPGRTLALEAWAGASRIADVVELNGKFSLFEKGTRRKISRVLFVHWASSWRPKKFESFIMRLARRLRVIRTVPGVGYFLPWRSLWRRFYKQQYNNLET